MFAPAFRTKAPVSRARPAAQATALATTVSGKRLGRVDNSFTCAAWLIAQEPERFSFLAEVAQFHAAYSSAFLRRRGAWADGASDTAYQTLVNRASSLVFCVETA